MIGGGIVPRINLKFGNLILEPANELILRLALEEKVETSKNSKLNNLSAIDYYNQKFSKGLNLANRKLRFANFHNSIMYNVNLQGSTLVGADSSHSSLLGSKIAQANMKSADFRYATLCETIGIGYRQVKEADFSQSCMDQEKINKFGKSINGVLSCEASCNF